MPNQNGFLYQKHTSNQFHIIKISFDYQMIINTPERHTSKWRHTSPANQMLSTRSHNNRLCFCAESANEMLLFLCDFNELIHFFYHGIFNGFHAVNSMMNNFPRKNHHRVSFTE